MSVEGALEFVVVDGAVLVDIKELECLLDFLLLLFGQLWARLAALALLECWVCQ
jgi:hypothetical protein